MNKQQKAKKIQAILEELFPAPPIPLTHKDAYTLLIAVLLSAQCQDARVNIVTKKLFAKADTPEKMIQLSKEEIQELVRSCGFFRVKASNIWELSKILVEKYGGKVPGTLKELEELPGVGHKTASVVVIHSFGLQAFPVDTHIHRIAKRWGLTKGKTVEETEADLKKLFPKKLWEKLHLQMIYFARKHCPAKKHNPANCPICSIIYD